MSREDAPPAVGYKKPPQKTRFQKGQSGNPSGRRKSNSNTKGDGDQPFLSRKMRATIAGKRVWMTKRDLAQERLFAFGMEGNIAAFALLFKLDMANDNEPEAERLLTAAEEEALIERFLARKRSGMKGAGDE